MGDSGATVHRRTALTKAVRPYEGIDRRGRTRGHRAHPQRPAQPAAGHRPGGDPGVARVARRGRRRARPSTARATSCSRCCSGPASAASASRAWPPPTTSTRSRPRREPWFPGDEEVERRFRRWIRWNAAIMVHRAQRPGIGVGGHISTYASSATLYEVGFNHFFRGKDHPGGGDQIYFQGHASPGMYARAFLEGRLTERPARRLPAGAVARRRRAVVVPAPAADAGLLGVPDRLDGPRPDQRDLPGAVQPLPARPRHQGHLRPARLGVPRRRRDGRARVAAARCSWPPARSSTTSPSSSTATCSGSTARSAATARSSRSSRRSSAAPAGTSSRSSGAASGTRCSPRTATARWST